MTEVPLIDLGAEPPAALAARIDAALCGTGFFLVSGHGVPDTVVQGGLAAAHAFFAMNEEQKARWHIDRSNHRRGFDPMGWQSLDPANPPDVKESFYIGNESLGPNQWPDAALLPEFKPQCQAYMAAMGSLSLRLLRLFEWALQLPEGQFAACMRNPVCTTRLLHYPPQPAQAAPGQIGCGAHTDWGALTLLAQDDAGGLQVHLRDGSWTDVQPVPGAFVVNVGDMMQRWTNDRWPSTMHRVINRLSGRDRWSVAYFCDLDNEAVITPLPSCVSAEKPARYAPITAGEHLDAMYKKTTVAA